jgi:hypothetical protein
MLLQTYCRFFQKNLVFSTFSYEWGSGGRWFKSSHSDQVKNPQTVDYQRFAGFLVFLILDAQSIKNREKLQEILLYCIPIADLWCPRITGGFVF